MVEKLEYHFLIIANTYMYFLFEHTLHQSWTVRFLEHNRKQSTPVFNSANWNCVPPSQHSTFPPSIPFYSSSSSELQTAARCIYFTIHNNISSFGITHMDCWKRCTFLHNLVEGVLNDVCNSWICAHDNKLFHYLLSQLSVSDGTANFPQQFHS